MGYKIPNAQYNVAAPDSLPIRIATFQRRRIYERFVADTRVELVDTVLDVGVTSDRSYSNSNYVESWYPEKRRITAGGIDDARFLVELYPGVSFIRANGLCLPFNDRSFDVVHSSAVLEHVGSVDNQIRFISECARVARKAAFLTTPNRWFAIEFHTVLPIVHWLPKRIFRRLMRRTGRHFFAEEANLNLMTAADLDKAARAALNSRQFTHKIGHVRLACLSSNLLLIVVRLQ
jgi:hypothetical protein